MSVTAPPDQVEKLWSLMKTVGFAMLVTEDGDHLRARPMVPNQDHFDGTLWFYTRASSHKVGEVEHDARVCVTYAEPSKQDYVSLSGRARLVRDKATIKAHWSEGLRTWFPKGVDDPDIGILEIKVDMAEYWDAPSSTMVHAYGYVTAALTGKPPSSGDNEKVRLA
jgi:general stress protein 26